MKAIPALSVMVLSGLLAQAASAVVIDQAVPSDQRKVILDDYQVLGKLQLQAKEEDRSIARLLGLRNLTSADLGSWLDQRVSTVVSERTELEKSVRLVSRAAFYPNSGSMPDIDPPVPTPTPKPSTGSGPSFKPVVVMSNVGSAIYMYGKQSAKLLGLQLSDGKTLAVRSPRTGIIQIGEGLFLERLRVSPGRVDLQANSLGRLATFFHEARHSDGNGKSLAFAHAMCPIGHAYQGYYACEKNLNGPYTVGAKVLKLMTEACLECSTKEKTVLQMIQADSLSRVIPTFTRNGRTMRAQELDPTPEKVLYSI
jgi:hypothetical protein